VKIPRQNLDVLKVSYQIWRRTRAILMLFAISFTCLVVFTVPSPYLLPVWLLVGSFLSLLTVDDITLTIKYLIALEEQRGDGHGQD
jgi:hypothetical protein